MATQYVIKRGDLGIGVNKLQAYLNMMQQRNLISTVNKQDGVFGPLTETAVREWQRYAGLPIDGIINYNTWNSLVDKLINTDIAVQQYQYLYDLNVDGVIGSMTWDSIINERNKL